MTTQAKVLGAGDLRRLISHVRRKRRGLRNIAMVLLSVKAGLRAAEIAGLDWRMLLRADGEIGNLIVVSGTIAKNGRSRRVALNQELASALNRLWREQEYPSQGAVTHSERGGHMCPGAVVNWFSSVYRELGLDGCSSHSGRRTFITKAARVLHRAGGSLRDVQLLAGHASIVTTQRYIDGDSDAQRRLVRLI